MQSFKSISSVTEIFANLPQKKIAHVCSLLLLLLIAYLAAQLTWLILSKPAKLSQTNHQLSGLNKTTSDNYNISTITTLNLFGQFQKQQSIAKPENEVKEVPLTSLDLTLMGVVASSEPEWASAIINKSGKQVSYGIGDKIDDTRAVVEHIYFDRVILKHAGKLETLMLDEEEYKKQPRTSSSNNFARLKSNNNRLIDNRKNNKLSNQAAVLKETLSQNPDKITDYLKISPKRVNGEITGYRLMPGKNPEFFRSSGLKSGDVAIQMNGYDLMSPFEAAQALQALQTETEVSLLVERGEETTEVLFSIQN